MNKKHAELRDNLKNMIPDNLGAFQPALTHLSIHLMKRNNPTKFNQLRAEYTSCYETQMSNESNERPRPTLALRNLR